MTKYVNIRLKTPSKFRKLRHLKEDKAGFIKFLIQIESIQVTQSYTYVMRCKK